MMPTPLDPDDNRFVKIEKIVSELDHLVLGGWDLDTGTRKPGLVEKVNIINDKLERQSGQLTFLVHVAQWGLIPVSIVGLVTLGGSTAKDILPIIFKFVISFIH